MTAEDNVRVSYGVKELLNRIDEKLARIDDKLDAKADIRDVVDLKTRMDGIERREEARSAVERDRKEGFTRREKLIGLALGVLAVVAQFVLSRYHVNPGG